MKLQARLVAAGVLFILAALTVAGFAYVRGREQALRDAQGDAEDLARALEQYTSVVVRGLDRGLSVIRERIDADALDRPDRRAFFYELLNRWARADALAVYVILDRNGVVIHRSSGIEREPTDNSDQEFFRLQRDNPEVGLVIGAPFIARSGPLSGHSIIVFSRRLSASDGSFAGVVAAAVSTNTLREFFDSLNVGRNGMVQLFRRDGTLLARSPPAEDAGLRRFDALEPFWAKLTQADHGTYRVRSASDNIDRIVAYRAVSQYPLVVTVSVADAEIIAAWQPTALIGASALLALAAAAMALLLWLAAALKREAASTRALAVNEARARSTLETLADGVITVDARGAVQSFNPAAERMFGYTAAEVIGGTADRLLGVGRLSEILTSAEPVSARRHEIEARRVDGQHFPAELRFGVAHGDPAVGDLTIVTIRDLTEEKALQHQFEQSQKLEVIGHLTGGIAHDFGNVLAGITTNIESSLRQMSAKAAGREPLDAALQATRSGREIVQRLLAFARRQPLNPCSSDLNLLISGSMPLLRQGRGPGIRIETRLSGGLPPILIDRGGLESAVLNLVINANDAMQNGGTIVVETGQVLIGAARAAEWGVRAGPHATLAVRDTGSGMAAEVRHRIFEPFFSTKPTGTGLGLSMVHRFVAQSGGHLEVDSKPGAGTNITMYFPIQRSAPAGAAGWFSQLAASAPAPSTGRSILVVEDNPIVRDGLMALLRQLGHQPIEAPDAEQAAALLDQNPQIELLLTDIGLPGRNGRQLVRSVRTRRPGIKVLFATGYDTMANGERPLAEVDANTGLLMKPFFEEDLIKEIDRLFRTSPRPNGERKPRTANGGR